MYGTVVVLRNWMFDLGVFRTHRVGVPVVSVGNLTVGGTGKTPLVEYVVGRLLALQRTVAVVSRGYKRTSRGMVVVSDGHTLLVDAKTGGDEPYQIARKYPSAVVIVDEQRVRGTRHAVERHGAQVVVLDDGFQHRSIHRNVDILVVDVECPPHTTPLLPAGLRREPLSAIRRANAIVFSRWRSDNGQRVKLSLRALTGQAVEYHVEFVSNALVRFEDGTKQAIENLRGRTCVVFCGIARPRVFQHSLEEKGLVLKKFRPFPDHYFYTSHDMERIVREHTQLQADFIVTTEKDAVRLMTPALRYVLQSVPLYYVELETRLSDSTSFSQLLERLFIQ